MKDEYDASSYHVLIPAAGKSSRLAHLTRNKPKAFIDIAGKSVIEHNLDILNSLGFKKVTFVVGYMKEFFIKTLGGKYKNINIEYVISENYTNTEHGWSFYLTKDSWMKEKKDVLFMDADNIFDRGLINMLITSKEENISLIDKNPQKKNSEEELVIGKNGLIEGFERGIFSKDNKFVGEFLGINKFSSKFMEALYKYMDEFFAKNGPKYKYEIVLHNFIKETGAKIKYYHAENLFWVNINNEESYKKARYWLLNK